MKLEDMSFENWDAVVAPKVQGTWNLHEKVPGPLDFFILCSSYSGIVGQWGQANYAAANTFLDAFVQYRHGLGLKASVLDIGVMGEVGFVSQNTEVLNMFRKSGLHVLREQNLLDAFHLAMRSSQPRPASPTSRTANESSSNIPHGQILLGVLTTVPIASPNNRVVWKRDVRMSIYHNIGQDAGTSSSSDADGANEIPALLAKAAITPEIFGEPEVHNKIANAIAAALARFLIRDEDSMDISLPADKLGVDSLVAMELRNWVRQTFAVDISIMIIVQSQSLVQLASHICKLLAK